MALREFSDLIGSTLSSVKGMEKNSDEIVLTTTTGRKFKMWHEQDCCEGVSVEDVTGDVQDLMDSPLVMAEEVSSEGVPPRDPDDERWGDFEWTFYKLGTAKGSVTVRWYGTSNGYYSTSVSFAEVK